ncbi:MAG: dGTP triphosphohydrolase, partial [Alphaproteobacteria bacterium]
MSGRLGGARPAGGRWRAPWASDPAQSRGRVHGEAASPYRSPFQRDRDRIVHTNAFRRLLGKTQVFVQHEGDHHRTRLTHTLEVAQIARSIARPLGLDEDLTEALALAHDLGHTPFGHAGERALNATLADHGGFDHNAQSLRIVTELERRYPEFDGLNLTWETLEGLVKHNGPVRDKMGEPTGPYAGRALPYAIARQMQVDDLDAARSASLEAQVAAISDDIAYDSHDIDDALRSGILTPEQLCENTLCRDIVTSTTRTYPDLDADRIGYELVRQLITRMIEDVVTQTFRRLEGGAIESPDDVRAAGQSLCGFSADMT